MLAFTLGTTPVFFTIAYFAMRLGATLEKYFTQIIALTVIVLGLVSIDSGLNLIGSPISITKAIRNLKTGYALPDPALAPGAAAPAAQNGYFVDVKDNGYSPRVLHLAANKPITLNWVTSDTHSCALSVVIPRLNYQKILPSTGRVSLDIPAQEKSTVIAYSCSMGMYTGQLVFDLE